MKLSVLGANGGVGRHLVAHALADGHEVTAAVRDPARFTQRHPHLSVVRADALDPESVQTVLDGADAVLSGVGQAGRHDEHKPASSSARAAVEAMNQAGVRRIVTVSAAPLNRSGQGQPWTSHRLASPLLWSFLRDLYIDLETMERVLRESDLDWTAVRPPKLNDRPGRGRYRHLVGGGPAGVSISRADVARAMLDFVDDPTTIGQPVGVSH